MQLRPFRPDDLRTLYEIDQTCFVPEVAYSQEELAEFISHRRSQTWVAAENDEVAGFLIAQHEPRKLLHIVTIDVVESQRRRGVGKLLMDAVENWGREHGVQLIALETAEDNLTGQKFYAARGYRKVDEIEGYYGDGKTAWVMVKELP
jgi:[ribosomal protein S18]-alanine N-acetyltransferase